MPEIENESIKKQKKSLKIQNYINSGFLIINVPLWIKNNISEKIFDFIRKNDGNLTFPDQDAINVVCQNTILLLPRTYNSLQNFWNEVDLNPKIIHFCGRIKPWNFDYYLRY